MIFVLSFFWLIRQTKTFLFWLYLWQLKEYHLGRFIAHFSTIKGKKLLINKLLLIKLIFIFIFSLAVKSILLLKLFLYLLIVLYFFESIWTFRKFLKKKLKKPILTKKTGILIFFGFLVEILIIFFVLTYFKNIYQAALWFLVFDIFCPLITSAIVLLFQPLTAILRSQIIKKAKKKRLQPSLHPPACGGPLEKFKDLLVIGITGSYGKTSTKEFLATILSEKFKVLKTKEHQNSEVGISQCILNDLNKDCQVFIVEMGAYNRGGIRLLSDIVKPKIGILTGINQQHMATFGSLENIIQTKYELIENLPKNGLAIFNGGNKYCQKLYKETNIPKKIVNTQYTIPEFRKNQDSAEPSEADFYICPDLWAEDIKTEKEFITFKVNSYFAKQIKVLPSGARHGSYFAKQIKVLPSGARHGSYDGGFAEFKVNLLGKQNIENILLAACCAKELGMDLKEIARACQKIKPEQGTMILKKVNGLNIIDSTYSANPDGVIADLDYLKVWSGKKIIIMPCLIELGKVSKEVHQKIGRKIGQVCNLAIITTGEYFKDIKKSAIENGIKKENILFLENSKEILKKIRSFSGKDDVILLESRIPVFLTKQLTTNNLQLTTCN